MPHDEILQLTVAELKEKLKENNLSIKGNKAELQGRLISFFESGVEEASFYEDSLERSLQVVNDQQEVQSIMAFTLRDIQDSLTVFDGSQQQDVDNWLADFENCAETNKWNDLQKFIYSRQLLKGAAKLFVGSEDGLTDRISLKSALEREFSEKLSAKQVHKLLENRKKKQNESVIEYFYEMKSLAKKSTLDKESVIVLYVVCQMSICPQYCRVYNITSGHMLNIKVRVTYQHFVAMFMQPFIIII